MVNVNGKILGILGGVGTLATAFFVTRLAELTDAETDQEHIPYICFNHAQIPDRTAFLTGKSDADPRPYLMDGLKFLEQAGADAIAIPCNTSFCFYDELREAVSIPIINMPEETVKRALSSKPDGANAVNKIGILATTGTVSTGLYQKIASSFGVDTVVPDDTDQAALMRIIYEQVKTGNTKHADIDSFMSMSSKLLDAGADMLIAGCTELSVLNDMHRDAFQDLRLIDAMDVLAEQSIIAVGKSLK